MNQDSSHLFSCDLVAQATKHKHFLRKLHRLGITLQKPGLDSFRRYTELWLPLVDSHYQSKGCLTSSSQLEENLTLIPPADIAWIWFCHRLAPARYVEYTTERFFTAQNRHCILDPEYPFWFQYSDHSNCDPVNSLEDGMTFDFQNEDEQRIFERSCTFTQTLWEERYTNEPFFLLDNMNENRVETSTENRLLGGFDILESCERQSAFLWQISGDRYSDPSFIRQGVQNYHKFLLLKKTPMGQSIIIVPTYQIDLMWHTHIASSISKYNLDCLKILNRTLHHDDSLTDRTEGSTLDVSFRATKKLWEEQYGEEYSVHGGMYRGEPPRSYYSKDWPVSTPTGEDFLSDLPIQKCFYHLVGIVGASSTGQSEVTKGSSLFEVLEASSKDVVAERNELEWLSVDAENAFVWAGLENKTYPRMKHHIYGDDCRGYGYYHIQTKEAFQLIRRKLALKISELKCKASCCFCFNYKEDIKNLDDLKNLITTIYTCSRLMEPQTVSPDIMTSLKRMGYTRKTQYITALDWFNANTDFFCDAGGCGGGNYVYVDNGGGGGG